MGQNWGFFSSSEISKGHVNVFFVFWRRWDQAKSTKKPKVEVDFQFVNHPKLWVKNLCGPAQARSGFEFEKIQARPVTILKDTPTITWQDDFIRLSSSSEKKQTRTSYSYSFDFVLVYNNDRTYSFNCKIFL